MTFSLLIMSPDCYIFLMSPIGACNLLIYNQYLYLVYSEFFTGLAVHVHIYKLKSKYL